MRFRRRPDPSQPAFDVGPVPAPATRSSLPPPTPGRFRRRQPPGPAPPPPRPPGRGVAPPPPPPTRVLAEVPYRFTPVPEVARPAPVVELLSRVRLGVVLVTVTALPLLFVRFNFDLFNLAKTTLLWLSALLCLGLGVGEAVLGGWRNRFGQHLRLPGVLAGAALGLVVAGLISTLWSVNQATSVLGRYHRYNGLLTLTALVVLAFFAAVDLRRHVLMRLLLAGQLLGTVVGVAYAILQWKGAKPCGSGCFEDPFFHFLWTSTSPVFGTWGNPDFLAAGAAIGVFAALGLALSTRRAGERLAFLAAGIVCVAGVWVSGPRLFGPVHGRWQGWFALLAGLAAVAFLYRDKMAAGVKLLLGASAVVMVAVVLLAAFHPGGRAPGLLGRFEDTFRYTLDVRVRYWEAAIRGLAGRPLTGEGLDSFAETFALHRSVSHAARSGLSDITDKPHSVPLEWFQATGVLGGVAFLALVVGAVVVADRATRRLAGPGLPVRRGILAGAVGMLCAYAAQSVISIDVPPLWAVLWWSVALVAAASRGSSTLRPPERVPRRAWRQATAVVAGVVVVLLGWFALGPMKADVSFRRATDEVGRGSTAALVDYERAISQNPHEAFYRASLGQDQAFTALQNPQKADVFEPGASENYAKAAELEPGNPYHGQRAYRFYDGLAQIGVKADENRRRAEEWWQRTVETDPRDPDIWVDGGVLQLHAQEWAGAIARFEEALLIQPGNVTALKGQGAARVAVLDKQGALRAYDEAARRAPTDAEAQAGQRAAQALP